MSSKYMICLILCVGLPRVVVGQADAGRAIIGIAAPMGQLGQTQGLAESMRQSLIAQLRSQSVDAIPLAALGGAALQTEMQAKHCN